MNLHESDISERGKGKREPGVAEYAEDNIPLAAKPQPSDPLSLDLESKTRVAAQEDNHMDPNDNKALSYEEKRLTMKFGYWQSAVIIFQSTVGISWFTLHQPLLKVGLYLGTSIITLPWSRVTRYDQHPPVMS